MQTERNKILKYINRPYPIQVLDKYIWWDTFGIALIIAIAINLLQPFGINELHINYKYLLLSGFGVIYAFVNILYYLSFEKFFKNHKWTVKNEIIDFFTTKLETFLNENKKNIEIVKEIIGFAHWHVRPGVANYENFISTLKQFMRNNPDAAEKLSDTIKEYI